jgi:hypothetical protein
MSFNLSFSLGKMRNKKERRTIIRNLLCLFFILLFLLNFFCITENLNQDIYSKTDDITEKTNKGNESPIASGSIPLLQDPFTINFSNIRNYFNTNFRTNLVYYDPDFNIIPTYFRDEFSNEVYSGDNLLLYKSLKKENYDEEDTIKIYVDLKSTPLWFKGNVSEYGFIKSINGTSGAIIDDNRYLVDNLMPIFLLLENIGEKIDQVSYLGETPIDSIKNTFDLINSTQFWDTNYEGFFQFNSSSGKKDTKSNFYSILANLLIYDFKNKLSSIDNDAYDLAEKTMEVLINNMWDNQDIGFYNRSDSDWSTVFDDCRKTLDTNALGIITLIDFWTENESMDLNSMYFKNATCLYNKLDEKLWDPANGAYKYAIDKDWNIFIDQKIDLEANALMMQACLKLFEVTGNISYYNRALELYNTFESKMYDTTVNAYKTSIGSVINNYKNFTSNLRLTEAYLKAFEIYNSTVLNATFNTTSQVPDLIINQDILNLTCDYAFEKTISYFRHGTGSNTTRFNNITNANITYIFYYPNNTIIEVITDNIDDNTTNLLYPINESLPIDDGYSITIYANTTFFGIAITTKTFNITSGLVSQPIQGLEGVDLYQGRTVNITLPINNTRNNNITLNITLNGFGIENATLININFTSYILTNISFNLTIRNDAKPGKRNISFKFKNGSIIYLEVIEEINILNALTYTNLIYHNNVVAGNCIKISMNLINFFPNESQSFNVSFSGNYINAIKFPAILSENQIKTVFYTVLSKSFIPYDSIEIEMSISVGETIFYTEILTVEILPKFEIISIGFPETVTQGVNPHLIIIIQNNQDSSEEFTIFINDDEVSTNLDELTPGENRIDCEVERFYNPYELGTMTYKIEIEDEDGDVIIKDYFEYEVELSSINLILFYLIPMIIPIGIILYFKNKDIKNKLLRR